jgi:hypothetical protein
MFKNTIPAALAISAGLVLTSPGVHAQQATPVSLSNQQDAIRQLDAEVNLMRKDLRDQKKQIVAQNLPLTPDEATKFWPVYDQYTADTIKVNDQRYALIKDYAAAYNNMTDEQASGYIKRWIGVDDAATQLRLKYIPMFEKVIPEKKVAMFFQIDRRLGLLLELQIAGQLPLVEP